jgi:cobaltochelatase CobT
LRRWGNGYLLAATLGARMSDEHRGLFQNLLSRIVKPEASPGYHAYTQEFDVVTDAANLDAVIGAPTSEDAALLRQASQEFETGLLPWKTRHHILAAERSVRLRETLSTEQRASTVVSLLFDQSGSMRGQKILFAAASADLCQEFLTSLGIRTEVLGFTTVRWRGGKSRMRWINRLRPRNPGRLNDLLHVIYRSADDDRVSTGGPAIRQMLRPDLTKENIDGEAINWAIGRLRVRPEPRKLLIVISDGAPVDDSTLHENGLHYLHDHLIQVIGSMQESSDIELGAVGLGFDVSRLYARSAFAEGPDMLGGVMVEFLEAMLVPDRSTVLANDA